VTDPTYALHPDLRLTALDTEGVALHLGEKRYFTVNDTGLTVLEVLRRGPAGAAALVDALLDEYEVSESLATETVSTFLQRCLDAKLIRIVP
jgi:hypothetical protein